MLVDVHQPDAINTDAANEASSKLKLYVVTSPWHPRDPEMGTVCEKVWAVDDDDAARELAVRMAECEDSGCESDEEEAAWVEEHLEGCRSQMDIVEIGISVIDDIRELIAGPRDGALQGDAKADYEAIIALLAKYTNPR